VTEKTEKINYKKFAGMEVPPELTRTNFSFLFVNTLLMGIIMSCSSILQPAFLRDIIKINQDFAGSINSFLVVVVQVPALALVAYVGVLSDKTGRKILALFGFAVLAIFYYLYWLSNDIASFLHVPTGVSSIVCALSCFAPSRSASYRMT